MQLILTAGFVLSFIVWMAAANWKAAGKAVILLVILEGAFRKWLLPGYANQIYFLKDAALLGSIIGILHSNRRPKNWLPISVLGLSGLLALYGFLEMFNPIMASIPAGIMGVKAYVLWIGYAFVINALFDTKAELLGYFRSLLYTAIPVCCLAVAQYALPADHFLNVYAREADYINTFDSGNVRVTGTFPFLSGFGYYLLFITVFLLPTLTFMQGRLARLFQFILWPLVMGAAFMTGSRTTVFGMWMIAVAFAITLQISGTSSFKRLAWLLIGCCSCVIVTIYVFSSSWNAWSERLVVSERGGDTVYARTVAPIIGIWTGDVFSVFGNGIGSTNNAAVAFAELIGAPIHVERPNVEDEPGRVMAELGLVGVVLWYSIKFLLFAAALRLGFRLRDSFDRALVFAAAWFLFVCLKNPVVVDPSLAAFYWFLVGVVFLLPKLQENRAGPWPRERRLRRPGRHLLSRSRGPRPDHEQGSS